MSREPNVHLGPQAFGTLPGETDSFVQQKADRVEKENQALRQERSGVDERIEAKAQEISGIEQELRRIEGWIRETVERIAERARSIVRIGVGAGKWRVSTKRSRKYASSMHP